MFLSISGHPYFENMGVLDLSLATNCFPTSFYCRLTPIKQSHLYGCPQLRVSPTAICKLWMSLILLISDCDLQTMDVLNWTQLKIRPFRFDRLDLLAFHCFGDQQIHVIGGCSFTGSAWY